MVKIDKQESMILDTEVDGSFDYRSYWKPKNKFWGSWFVCIVFILLFFFFLLRRNTSQIFQINYNFHS